MSFQTAEKKKNLNGLGVHTILGWLYELSEQSVICSWWKRGCSHLVSGEAEVVGQDLPVAEPAWEVVYDVLIVQFIVLIQVLLKAFLL